MPGLQTLFVVELQIKTEEAPESSGASSVFVLIRDGAGMK